MRYTPLNFEKINGAAGRFAPSSVKSFNNYSFYYWSRSLFQRAASVLDFTVPDEWEGKTKDFFIYSLFKYGYIAIFENDKFGRCFQPCTLKGYDFYYQPTDAIIANPLYSGELTIGSDCELLKLTPDYEGIFDIIEYYAEKLSMLDIAINTSIVNSKLAYILGAKNKGAAQALKKVLDQINKGEPAVIYDRRIFDDAASKDSPFQSWVRDNMKNNYITPELLQDFRTIINNFDSEIGIPTLPYAKKERLVTEEADATTLDAIARCTVWEKTLNSSIKEIKKLYPDINLSVKLQFKDQLVEVPEPSIKEGGEDNE